MPEEEPHTQPDNNVPVPDPAEAQGQRLKTVAIRIDETLHAQLQFIAQLGETTITDEIRRAIENRIATAHDDPELIARAQRVRAEIEREAAARSAAIAGFMGTNVVADATTTTPKPRRGSKPDSE